MIAEYLLLVSLLDPFGASYEEYVGNFTSCDKAHMYYIINFDPLVTSDGYRCINEEYVHLPEDWDTTRKEIHE